MKRVSKPLTLTPEKLDTLEENARRVLGRKGDKRGRSDNQADGVHPLIEHPDSGVGAALQAAVEQLNARSDDIASRIDVAIAAGDTDLQRDLLLIRRGYDDLAAQVTMILRQPRYQPADSGESPSP